MTRKFLAIGLASVLAASTVYAGGLGEPVVEMDPAVVEAGTSSSAGGIIVPLLLILLIGAAISGSNSAPVAPVG